METNIPGWGAIQMNISKVNYEYSLEYSEMVWISKWISNTSRNEDWIFKQYSIFEWIFNLIFI